MRTPVLLTADESTGSLAAVRGLAAGGYAPFVATFERGVYAARSRAAAGVDLVPDAAKAPEAFVAAVARVVERRGVVAVLPGTEATLRALSGRESRLPPVALGMGPPDLVSRVLDKPLLDRLGPACGLRTPETVEVGPEDVEARIGEVAFPAVVKAVASVTHSAGAMRTIQAVSVASPEQLREVLAELAPGDRRLVQRSIEGTLYAVCGVVWDGEVICSFHQRSPRIWPPGIGGTSYGVVVDADRRLDAGVRHLLAAVGWSGIFCVQFLEAERETYLIDLNPRVYGSMALALGAGYNLPSIWADLLLGRSPRIGARRPGARFRAEEDDVRALAHLYRTGHRAEALRGLVPHPRTVHPVWSWRDPAPAWTTVMKLMRRARRRLGQSRSG